MMKKLILTEEEIAVIEGKNVWLRIVRMTWFAGLFDSQENNTIRIFNPKYPKTLIQKSWVS